MRDPNSVASPLAPFIVVWTNRALIRDLTRREISSRYKEAWFGLFWAGISPLLMLLAFVFVFGVVFNIRGQEAVFGASHTAFIFSGLVVFWLFAECVAKAPNMVVANRVYVKKVVFPLEILPIVSILSGLFHSLIGFFVLLVVMAIIGDQIYWTVVFLPLVLTPLVLMLAGFCWFLSGLGVFFRDLTQLVGPLTQFLMLMSPVMYPLSMVPRPYNVLLYLNPMTVVLEEVRQVLFAGQLPDPDRFVVMLLVGWLIAVLGYAWFCRTRKVFADVL